MTSPFASALLALASGLPSPPALPAPPDGVGAGLTPPAAGLRIDRGEGELDLVVPANEALRFRVQCDLPLLGWTSVGSFELTSGLEPYSLGLPVGTQDLAANVLEAASSQAWTGWFRGRATGGALGYSVDHVIESRILPQVWPRVVYREAQKGSENRQRELRYGEKDGESAVWFRSDRHCKGCKRREHFVEGSWPFSGEKHCKKCKRGEHRVWRDPESRNVPADAVDMLGAIYLSRTMMREELSRASFPLIDQMRLWRLVLHREERRKVRTPAGTFLCRAVKMEAQVPKGEDHEEKFEGLFGIHGSLTILLEERTGVPVMIEGEVPLGPLKLGTRLLLVGHRGTPGDFESR